MWFLNFISFFGNTHSLYFLVELKEMSCSALNEVLTEYELVIKELSEILIRELALRDELEDDKELKNQTIYLLLTIQKKRKESKFLGFEMILKELLPWE